MKNEPVTISEQTMRAIHTVCQAVGPDMERGMRAAEWAEVAIDANRLTTIACAPEAEKEIDALIAKHGYPKVLRAIAKHTNYE